MKAKHLQILVFLIVLLLIVNIVLFALKVLNEILFWAMIIAAAVFTYKVLPRIKK